MSVRIERKRALKSGPFGSEAVCEAPGRHLGHTEASQRGVSATFIVAFMLSENMVVEGRNARITRLHLADRERSYG